MIPLGYQLYSSRNFPPLDRTLTLLAGIGYAEVEGYGALFRNVEDVPVLRDQLARSGLTMPTAHFGLDLVQDTPEAVIGACRELGVGTVFIPYLMPDDRPGDPAGWTAFGHALAEAGKPLQDAGLGFGWHNHDFEMADLGIEETPLDLVLAASDDLLVELDVAWIVKGGRDPMTFIGRYGPRIRAVHVKDIAAKGTCSDEDGWADVGHGVLDWPTLHAALSRAKVRHLIMEHDNPADDARFARRSFLAVASYLEDLE